MKWFFVVVVVLHGLIHLLGFAKAFGLAEVAQLQQPISRPLGALWLLAAVLFVVTVILLFAAPSWWWVSAAAAVLLSQGLIVSSWKDARFGTIANVIVLVPLVIAILGRGPSSFRASYQREVARGLARTAEPAPITEAEIARLPAPLQRYLRTAGVLGKEHVRSFHVRFRGQLKSKPDADWMSFTADQTTFLDEPTRLFFIESSMFGIPFDALHAYVGPSATMKVRLASLLTMVDAKGPEMNRSETVTMLNDLCLLAPGALVLPAIRWEERGPLEAKATYTNAGNTVSAVLSFNEAGELVSFFSDDRYLSADGKVFTKYRWTTPVLDHRDFGGVRIAARAEAIWDMPDGPFTYGRFEVVDIEYNVSATKR